MQWLVSIMTSLAVVLVFLALPPRPGLILLLAGMVIGWGILFWWFPDREQGVRPLMIWCWGALCGALADMAIRNLEKVHEETTDPRDPGGLESGSGVAEEEGDSDGKEYSGEPRVHQGGTGR
jgi:hypothetical protein